MRSRPWLIPLAPPPHDTRAERLVLCGLTREFAAVWLAVTATGLTAEDLYWHHHRLAWSALAACYDAAVSRDEEPGPYALWRRLTLAGQAADFQAGLAAWVLDLIDEDPTGAWAAGAAVEVRRLAVRRRLVHRANEILRDARDGWRSPQEYAELLATID